jgi:hypothetical protein
VRGELLNGDVEACGSLACGEQTVRIADRLRLGLPVEIEQATQPIALAVRSFELLGRRAVMRGLHQDRELVTSGHARGTARLELVREGLDFWDRKGQVVVLNQMIAFPDSVSASRRPRAAPNTRGLLRFRNLH